MNVFILSMSTSLCLKVHKAKLYIIQKKLIKGKLLPINEIKPNSKVHNYFYFLFFSPLKPKRAERWIWETSSHFPQNLTNVSKTPKPWMSGSQIKQRDFPLIFYIPHKGQNTSQYSKEPGTDWSAHQSFLFMGPWYQKS